MMIAAIRDYMAPPRFDLNKGRNSGQRVGGHVAENQQVNHPARKRLHSLRGKVSSPSGPTNLGSLALTPVAYNSTSRPCRSRGAAEQRSIVPCSHIGKRTTARDVLEIPARDFSGYQPLKLRRAEFPEVVVDVHLHRPHTQVTRAFTFAKMMLFKVVFATVALCACMVMAAPLVSVRPRPSRQSDKRTNDDEYMLVTKTQTLLVHKGNGGKTKTVTKTKTKTEYVTVTADCATTLATDTFTVPTDTTTETLPTLTDTSLSSDTLTVAPTTTTTDTVPTDTLTLSITTNTDTLTLTDDPITTTTTTTGDLTTTTTAGSTLPTFRARSWF
ncbi:hypothetical protein AG1IA_09157 [Rhizoctonia solani AG-1 IA]|uniref:Uncharacterized protein n=1 Tax=Thanatephorus cucumeris (strain AG1-IA) TaxID=983506 RepID=L8WKE2_THACA|nr:hypothetical protein AG1IA_09157 [Rhizoctonia solani AG-1 IA]